MILRYVVLCVHCTVINKLGLAGPEASPNCPLLSNNFLFKLYWTDRKNISPQLIPQTSVSLCCCHTILTAVVAVDSLTGLCCCCDFAVADSAAVAVRPEAEVGRDLLIIWCVGGGERERETTDSYTDTLSGPSEAAVSRPLIGQSSRVAVFLLARCVAVQAPAWAQACSTLGPVSPAGQRETQTRRCHYEQPRIILQKKTYSIVPFQFPVSLSYFMLPLLILWDFH